MISSPHIKVEREGIHGLMSNGQALLVQIESGEMMDCPQTVQRKCPRLNVAECLPVKKLSIKSELAKLASKS